jgi:hypothetical protein
MCFFARASLSTTDSGTVIGYLFEDDGKELQETEDEAREWKPVEMPVPTRGEVLRDLERVAKKPNATKS